MTDQPAARPQEPAEPPKPEYSKPRLRRYDQIEQVKEFVGITGVFSFSAQDHNGLDKRAVTVVTITGGKWTPAK